MCIRDRGERAEAQVGPICVDQLVKAQGIAQALVHQEGGVEHQIIGRHHIQLGDFPPHPLGLSLIHIYCNFCTSRIPGPSY